MTLSTFGEKSKTILTDGGFSSEDIQKVATYLEGIGSGLFYPKSLSLKLSISIPLITEMVSLLLAKRLLIHYSVPRFQGKVLTGEEREGFTLEFLDLQDPEDFTPIEPSDIEVISAFKVAK